MSEAPAQGYVCPKCGARVDPTERYRPFCGERCKMVDLSAWLLGHYRIPAYDSDDEDPAPAPPTPDDDDSLD